MKEVFLIKEQLNKTVCHSVINKIFGQIFMCKKTVGEDCDLQSIMFQAKQLKFCHIYCDVLRASGAQDNA